MLSTTCWLPNRDVERETVRRKHTLARRLLEAGLWTVPSCVIGYMREEILAEDAAHNPLREFLPTKASPVFTLPHRQTDTLFVVMNVKGTLEESLPLTVEKTLHEYFYKCYNDEFADIYQAIHLKFADIEQIVKAKKELKPLLNFNDTIYGGCISNSDPCDLTNSFSDGGSTCWGSTKGCFVFAATQSLSALSPWAENETSVATSALRTMLLEGDYNRTRLPKMEDICLTDSAKGHWDLYWPEGSGADPACYACVATPQDMVGRNPMEDVQENSVVAIDFGTASTVVAVRESNRSVHLLRVGMQNFQQASEAKHYENPTALEIVDYAALMQHWNNVPYRPWIRWEHVRCSHQAKAALCDAQVQVGVVRSGLTGIKTWARRKCHELPLRLRDQQGLDVDLLTPSADMPQDVAAHYADTALNPIELYAYFLGLNLNNQLAFGGCIYREYYMTFPVKFDRETRDRILKSFRRGLERSLPPCLAYATQWRQGHSFIVSEEANEPTAYAAAALPHMEGIVPSHDGVPFGVFDFGGGTTDFCFGLYRTPRPEEVTDCGWEVVLDILDSSGDESLGGEHLLHLLALHVVKNNLKALLGEDRQGQAIPFVLPAGEKLYGSELLQDNTAIAQSNTTKLCEALRPLWEEGQLPDSDTGMLSLTLWDRSGQDVPDCTLAVDGEVLNAVLLERIKVGVRAFFATFAQGFKKHDIFPREFHVLLAGNSCRSSLVKKAFEDEIQGILQEEREAIRLHPPLLPQEGNFGAPTLKTGVALGLLQVVPGESVGVVTRHMVGEQTPFRHCVGRFVGGKLEPVLLRNAPYGQWYALGKVLRHGMEVLGYSLSPQAIEGGVSSEDCSSLRVNLGTKNAGRMLFIQAVAPDSIALALSGEGGSQDESTRQELFLKDM